MSDLLAGYDRWLDAPYERDMEEREEASEEDDEDLIED